MVKKCSAVWKYYDTLTKITAKCRICQRIVPRKCQGTTNMRGHLQKKHITEYNEMKAAEAGNPNHLARGVVKKPVKKDLVVKLLPDSVPATNGDNSTYYEVLAADVLKDFDSDNETTKPAQQNETNDAWKYFEKITQNRSTQNILTDNDNYYTEVVYLEDDLPESQASNSKSKFKKLKRKPEPILKKEQIKHAPNARYENVIIKNHREEPRMDDTDEDIDNFGVYVIGLLKKLPKDVCTQLQMDIINMIMTAKLKLSTVGANTANISFSNDNVESPGSIVVTPSNVIHTSHNNERQPSFVIGDDKIS